MPIKGVPRAPHRDGCLCVVCKNLRAKVERNAEPIALPGFITRVITEQVEAKPDVQVGSLALASKFNFDGQEHRIVENIPDYVVCYNLLYNRQETFKSITMVTPI